MPIVQAGLLRVSGSLTQHGMYERFIIAFVGSVIRERVLVVCIAVVGSVYTGECTMTSCICIADVNHGDTVCRIFVAWSVVIGVGAVGTIIMAVAGFLILSVCFVFVASVISMATLSLFFADVGASQAVFMAIVVLLRDENTKYDKSPCLDIARLRVIVFYYSTDEFPYAPAYRKDDEISRL
jgi:hypothetical protein